MKAPLARGASRFQLFRFFYLFYNKCVAFFSFKKKEEYFLVLDLSSSSVGGALVLKEEGNVPLILYTSRKKVFSKPDSEIMAISKNMQKIIHEVCEDVRRNTKVVPEKIFCTLATPWAYGEFRSIKYESKDNFKFKDSLIQNLLDDEIKSFKEEWTGLRQIIDRRIIKITLNGYKVENPVGKMAKTLTLDVFLSFSLENLIFDIEDTIHKTFKAKIKFTSQMFTDFIVVRNISDLQNDFIILNFGEDVSEVTIMKDDFMSGTAFFPYGFNSIIKTVSNISQKSSHEVKSLFNLYHGGYLSGPEHEKFTLSAHQAGLLWYGEFRNALLDLVPTRYLPNHVFLTGNIEMKNWIENYIEKTVPEFTTLHNNFNVIIGDSRTLHPFVEFAENVDRDQPLAMKAIFINHI